MCLESEMSQDLVSSRCYELETDFLGLWNLPGTKCMFQKMSLCPKVPRTKDNEWTIDYPCSDLLSKLFRSRDGLSGISKLAKDYVSEAIPESECSRTYSLECVPNSSRTFWGSQTCQELCSRRCSNICLNSRRTF